MHERKDDVELRRFSRLIALARPWAREPPSERRSSAIGVLSPFTGLLDLRAAPRNWTSPTLSYLLLRPIVLRHASNENAGRFPRSGRKVSDARDVGHSPNHETGEQLADPGWRSTQFSYLGLRRPFFETTPDGGTAGGVLDRSHALGRHGKIGVARKDADRGAGTHRIRARVLDGTSGQETPLPVPVEAPIQEDRDGSRGTIDERFHEARPSGIDGGGSRFTTLVQGWPVLGGATGSSIDRAGRDSTRPTWRRMQVASSRWSSIVAFERLYTIDRKTAFDRRENGFKCYYSRADKVYRIPSQGIEEPSNSGSSTPGSVERSVRTGWDAPEARANEQLPGERTPEFDGVDAPLSFLRLGPSTLETVSGKSNDGVLLDSAQPIRKRTRSISTIGRHDRGHEVNRIRTSDIERTTDRGFSLSSTRGTRIEERRGGLAGGRDGFVENVGSMPDRIVLSGDFRRNSDTANTAGRDEGAIRHRNTAIDRSDSPFSFLTLRGLVLEKRSDSASRGEPDRSGGVDPTVTEGEGTSVEGDLRVHQLLEGEATEESNRALSLATTTGSERVEGDGSIGTVAKAFPGARRGGIGDTERLSRSGTDPLSPLLGRLGATAADGRHPSDQPMPSVEPGGAGDRRLAPGTDRPGSGPETGGRTTLEPIERASEQRSGRTPDSTPVGPPSTVRSDSSAYFGGTETLDRTTPRTTRTIEPMDVRRERLDPSTGSPTTELSADHEAGHRPSRDGALKDRAGIVVASNGAPKEGRSDGTPTLTVRRERSGTTVKRNEANRPTEASEPLGGVEPRSEEGRKQDGWEQETRKRRGDAPSSAPSLEQVMEVDRLVDRLYRGLERKMRIERERRGL